MVDGGDEDLAASDAIEDDVRSAADGEFAEVCFGRGVAEVWVESQRLDKGNDTSSQARRSGRII